MSQTQKLQLKTNLPEGLKKEFYTLMNIQNIARIYIIAWLGVVVYSLLFIIDFIRFQEDPDNVLYKYLFGIHLTAILFLIPITLIRRHREAIKRGTYNPTFIIYGTIVLLAATMFAQAFITFYDYERITFYLVFILLTNWAFALPHKIRIIFDGISLTIIITWILWVGTETMPVLLITIYEAIGFMVVAFLFGTFDLNLRAEKFLDEKVLEREKNKTEELEKFKSSLFTNLTHEFRTPLTIISGMAAQIENNPKKWWQEGVEMIKRNCAGILNLVNQMLDLSKLETGMLLISPVHADVVTYLQYVIEPFLAHAKVKKIQIHLLFDQGKIMMDYDPDRLLNIVSNLLSNAIKYTRKGGHVYVQLRRQEDGERSNLLMKIKDTGIGIPKTMLPKIFDLYFKGDEDVAQGQGTGMGLYICRELVNLLKGEITVQSELGKGTEFTVMLPIQAKAVPLRDYSPEFLKERASSFIAPGWDEDELAEIEKKRAGFLPHLLIIEDNPDVVRYLASCLENDYQLKVSQDGEEGITLAIQDVPDIIISDILMPKKDGFEVCRILKQDERTSHIPIILLTAKADQKSKITSFEVGADAFLTKPFSREELLVRLRKLIELRQNLQSRYSRLDFGQAVQDPILKIEDNFLYKVKASVDDNLDNVDFGALHLCRLLGLSRTQLHNKLKALTGRSTGLFIRFIRLQKARELLQKTDLTISEIAYDVGFKDPNYFTRTFVQEFGQAPSRTR
jgi:signal transduction histidine kinase/DNA-binding response OmpR family regulator